jgi:glucokinase
MPPVTPALVADVGATNARFALVGRDGAVARQRTLHGRDFPAFEDALAAYLAAEAVKPDRAAVAVACPVLGDRIVFTNSPWSFSIEALRKRFGLGRLLVLNDFEANALAVPHLRPADLVQVGGGTPAPAAPAAILGPGSGLGVAGLVRARAGWMALPGEGGHTTMPAFDEREAAVLGRLRARFGHVSAERVLSGPGLVNLHAAIAELERAPTGSPAPADVTEATDTISREAVDMFCAMLGTLAGNVALTLGARGGVYIAGGIVPKLGARFVDSAFRERFLAKGRFRDYLAAIPTFVVTHPVPAFVGLAALIGET